MYTVLIVDDEPLVQVGIQSMIDWAGLDMSLLPSAPNGMAAFEVIAHRSPDIVITDIRMPLLDGLGLIRKCKAEIEDVPEFIILTSYEEFSYVREAMKHQAVDYLIKLEINPQILAESLSKAKIAREAKRPRPENSLSGRDRAAFADRAFQRLLTREYDSIDEFHRILADLNIEFAGDLYTAVRCRALFPAEAHRNDEERLRLYFCAMNMMKEILSREYHVYPIPMDREQFLLFTASPVRSRQKGGDEARLQATLASASEMVIRYFNVRLSCGFGGLYTDPLHFQASSQEAASALDAATERFSIRGFASLSVLSPGEGASPVPQMLENFEAAVQTQDGTSTGAVLAEAALLLAQPGFPFTSGLDLCSKLCHAILSNVENGESLLDSFFGETRDGYRSLYHQASNQQLLAWLAALKTGIEAEFSQTKVRHKESIVHAMRAYLDSRFRERITLNDLARHFSLSPNYAGMIFKKYTGYGFPEYIARLKVAKASVLLEQGGHRIYEISELVGFENSFYFSKVFKRITGLSPKEYAARATGEIDREKS